MEEFTAIYRMTDGSKFEDLLDTILERWDTLPDCSTITIHYSLPGHSDCRISDQHDLDNLHILAKSFGLDRIDVIVNKGPIRDYDSDEDDVEEGSPSEMINVETDLLSDYCVHERKVLLSAGWSEGIREIGQVFKGGVVEFRRVLVKYSIEVGFKFHYLKNDKVRVTAACAASISTGCCWHVHVRVDPITDYAYIRKLENVHTCGAAFRTSKHPRMSSNLVASLVGDEVREKPLKRPIDVVHDFKRNYGLDISYNHAWLGVEKAKNDHNGDHSSSYDQLRWYVEECSKTNPGSYMKLEFDEIAHTFNRFFIAFGGCIEGFYFCRPMIFLDGTFLKGRFKGVLLAATVKDGNQGLFTLAFAVVDAENDKNWLWFLNHLSNIVSDDRKITFISDRNSGLVTGIPKVFPECFHAFCLEHLKANLRDKLAGRFNGVREKLILRFRCCAYAPTVEIFDRKVNKLIEEGGKKVADFIKDTPKENWANAHFTGQRYGEMTSNLAECFNAWISEARHLPVQRMVDTIRKQMMNMMSNRRKEANNMSGVICPVFESRLKDNLYEGRSWFVAEAYDGIYEVQSNPSVLVDTVALTCSCYQWQINGFPCAHACAAIHKSGKDLNSFVDPYYHVKSYQSTYASGIFPIPTIGKPEVIKDDVIILPPQSKKQPGRPRKKRIMSRGEQVRQIKCSRCGRFGHHNRKTCKAAL